MTQRNLLVAAASLGAAALACGPVHAGPIVAASSTYRVIVFNSVTPGFTIGQVRFDGVAESLTPFAGGRPVMLNEAQQDLGDGAHRISFVFSSSTDLFPTAGESGYVNIGRSTDPLDLLADVDLQRASLRMLDGTGAVVAQATFPNAIASWNGYWLDAGIGGGLDDVGGQDVRRIELDIFVQQIPEPATMALAAIGLLGAGVARRRTTSRLAR